MSNPQAINLLQNVYLFKELTPKELEQIAAAASSDSYNPGDEIFSQGDVAHSFYVIKMGSVRIQTPAKEDRIDVATLGSGSHFGEMAFIDREKRSASVVAIERTDIVRLDFDKLRQILDGNPAMATKVYRSMASYLCGRLRATTTDLGFAREKNLRHQ